MTALQLLSPAKLNLMLHITGRREDGYHLLETVFQLLDYGDTMTFISREDSQLTLIPQIAGVNHDDNLIIRAARLLQQATNCSTGSDIELQKRLPMGGGLGGGSSNAATTLLALNKLWQTHLTIDQLAELGLQLGADVPVFIRGYSAWGEGVGEQLQAIEIPDSWYLVIKPKCAISTAQIFSHKQLTRDTSPITIAAFFEQGGRNDCEPVVRMLYPEVDQAITWLSQFSQAQLTGTGACIFARFDSEELALQVQQQLPGDKELEGFVARGINVSPVHQQLELMTF